MILIHGSVGGLPEFIEIIHMVILADQLIFLVRKLDGWYIERYRSYDLKTSSDKELKVVELQDLSDVYPLDDYKIGGMCLIAMSHSKPARLKVILGESNTGKLTLPNGISNSLDELLYKVKDTFGLKNNFRLQYMDKDFGNDFFNLGSTSALEDLGAIKVIQQESIQPLIDVTDTASSVSTVHSNDSSSLASNDTVILSSPESLSSRTQQWPAVFPIPMFSHVS
ncbi:hypothetical protein GOODEAATRI_031214 [Goodea atripinnis]|uniref:Ubiquitin-like domain-containing protein n=1 Tax=Goodea atripinnis TaxID=208336 RepID=A0ABV0NF76_9TELE